MHLSQEIIRTEIVIVPHTYLYEAAMHGSYQWNRYEEGVVPIWGERIGDSSSLREFTRIVADPLGYGVGVGRATERAVGS